jgi:tRNA dimethylallyltransferase
LPAPTYPLLVIAGPTCCGKTEAALRVAEAVGGEIISADSMQIYRQLSIGTAKPTPAERARARFHLVDCVDVVQPFTASDFQRLARAAVAEIASRGRLPILCGGTGLYIRAVLSHFDFPAGQAPGESELRAGLEHDLEAHGLDALAARLLALDPAARELVDLRNPRRVVRALEVCLLTGEPFTARRRVDADPGLAYNHRTFVLSRPRAALYEAIDARVDVMLSAGWVDEVRELAALGLPPEAPALQAIGYRHLLAWLQAGAAPGELPAVVAETKRDTRRFARRQETWYRREREATWVLWTTEDEFAAAVGHLSREAQNLQCGMPAPWRPSGPATAGGEDERER